MKRGHYEWLEKQLSYRKQKVEVSEFGKVVADILGNVFDGLHHFNAMALFHKRTDWSNDKWIEVVIGGTLSTWDFNNLTELVVLCHDNAVRLEIQGANIGYLRLLFHKREREGGMSKRHPTMEGHIEMIRRHTQ